MLILLVTVAALLTVEFAAEILNDEPTLSFVSVVCVCCNSRPILTVNIGGPVYMSLRFQLQLTTC